MRNADCRRFGTPWEGSLALAQGRINTRGLANGAVRARRPLLIALQKYRGLVTILAAGQDSKRWQLIQGPQARV